MTTQSMGYLTDRLAAGYVRVEPNVTDRQAKPEADRVVGRMASIERPETTR